MPGLGLLTLLVIVQILQFAMGGRQSRSKLPAEDLEFLVVNTRWEPSELTVCLIAKIASAGMTSLQLASGTKDSNRSDRFCQLPVIWTFFLLRTAPTGDLERSSSRKSTVNVFQQV